MPTLKSPITNSNMLLYIMGHVFSKGTNRFVSKNDVPELAKQITIQRFGKEISHHRQSWTMSNINIQFLGLILNPEVSDIDMSRFLTGGHSPICFHPDRTLVILFKHILLIL